MTSFTTSPAPDAERLDLYAPRTVGALISLTNRFVLDHWRALVILVPLGAVPIAVVDGFVGHGFQDSIGNTDSGSYSLAATVLWIGVVPGTLSFVGRLVRKAAEPEGASPAEDRTSPALTATALWYFGSTLGLLLLIVPGVFLWGAGAFAGPDAVLSERKGMAALKRSIKVSRTVGWWRSFGLVLAFVLLSVLFEILASVPLSIVTGLYDHSWTGIPMVIFDSAMTMIGTIWMCAGLLLAWGAWQARAGLDEAGDPSGGEPVVPSADGGAGVTFIRPGESAPPSGL